MPSLLVPSLLTLLAAAAVRRRRAELRALLVVLRRRARAVEAGRDRPRLAAPRIDLARCLGCATCIRACPEEGVLDLAHGQAVLVHGARCQSHGDCASACPTDAISLWHVDSEERRDLPALLATLEVPDVPGLYLAGEVTGHALIRSAVAQVRVAFAALGSDRRTRAAREDDRLDLCIVGAGPAGLAAALEARARGLRFEVLEQDRLGGAIASYPRRKLVINEPLELPLGERLGREQYEKEELMAVWRDLVERHRLPVREGVRVDSIQRDGNGFRLRTRSGDRSAHRVLVACGRRGSPRKLGVPGEGRTKVAHSLFDARSHAGRRVLVVGGGDSAVEAALALCEQPGCEVRLSYRRAEFFRPNERNEERLRAAVHAGRVRLHLETRVIRIDADEVELERTRPEATAADTLPTIRLANDDVFVLIGGRPPFEWLERAGVSFDPADRSRLGAQDASTRRLAPCALVALGTSVAAVLLSLVARDYYGLEPAARRSTDAHAWLAPGAPLGLATGLVATFSFLSNLAYVARRAAWPGFRWGRLQAWMQTHIATGVATLAFALVHAGWQLRASLGGQAVLGLVALLVTGLVGRWLYALVPRSANGRELDLEDTRIEVEALAADWERRERRHGARLFARTIEAARSDTLGGSSSLLSALPWVGRRREARFLERFRREALSEELEPARVEALSPLARRAWRTAIAARRLEHGRAWLASWRYLHRFGAWIVSAWIVAHIVSACLYGGFLWGAVG